MSGLDTIVTGSPTSQVEPGHGKEQTEFTGSDEPPVQNTPGSLDIVLTTCEIKSLNPGAPIYYRGMEVGEVRALALNDNATQVSHPVETGDWKVARTHRLESPRHIRGRHSQFLGVIPIDLIQSRILTSGYKSCATAAAAISFQ